MGESVNEEADVQYEETSGQSDAAKDWAWGTGRRKAAIARVRVRAGSGKVIVNKKPLEEFFRIERNRGKAMAPLRTAKLEGRVDVYVNCTGGGITGQSEAMLMGLARALVQFDRGTEAAMRQAGHLTRDARRVERKKYGQAGARRKFQYSKR